MKIGNDGATLESKPISEVSAQLSNETDMKENRLEDYSRPLSVVGVVFCQFLVACKKSIRINEMLKEIRSALRKCSDSNKTLASRVLP
uniref:Uncharacterized protein n=1 Tax=Cajanus cajan TaxID=3821 RepID=A0A151QL31_CAJCA|nr:hypothetical protein KK1_049309 [Cajanus cajan]